MLFGKRRLVVDRVGLAEWRFSMGVTKGLGHSESWGRTAGVGTWVSDANLAGPYGMSHTECVKGWGSKVSGTRCEQGRAGRSTRLGVDFSLTTDTSVSESSAWSVGCRGISGARFE